MTEIQKWGAIGFGALIGWLVYFTNRYRKGAVSFNDLVTLIGIIGGGAVLTLFEAKSDLFGAYGIGLAVGFFTYFLFLVIFVLVDEKLKRQEVKNQNIKREFDFSWFLDGRCTNPEYTSGDQHPMIALVENLTAFVTLPEKERRELLNLLPK